MCALCQMFTGTPDVADKFIYAAYIDPGAGFVFSSAVPFILGIVTTGLGSLFFFLRKKIWPIIKKFKIIVFVFIIILISGIIINILKNYDMNTKIDKKVVIIGLDGLDPKLVQEGFDKGLLPNLKKLKESGTYSLLATTTPPQSPVAWASFMTGDNSGKHGVFDFIKRDSKTYIPDLVFSNPKKNPIQSTPFWEITAKNNIPTTVLFLPDTFPAPQFKGKLISGMGTPDILGTAGALTFFSTKKYPLDPKWRGRFVLLPNTDSIKTSLEGPKFTVLQQKKTTSIPFEIKKKNKNEVQIMIQNQNVTLKQNEFSRWVKLEFSIDFFTKIRGITQFYVKQIDPEIEIYASPLNFDPGSPVFPVSSPKNYAKELAQKYGLFSTLGLPHDTWALEENIFSEDAFLQQTDIIEAERRKIILGELNSFKDGVFFGYFGVTDTIQHMYWRYLKDDTSKYQNTIMRYYQRADETVGQIAKKLNKNDVLIILSDHGFDYYDYEINMNTWLVQNGYMVLKNGAETGGELLEDVDWSKTKAYALGYNGIYLNMKGREGQGIVTENEAENLKKEIKSKLLQIVNLETGSLVMKHIYTKEELGISNKETASPDLYLGFYKGIRSSWDTAVGAAPKDVIIKRQSKWGGDHLFDPTEVPGVLFMNKKVRLNNPRIIDVIPTALSLFDIPVPSTFDGKPLMNKSEQ